MFRAPNLRLRAPKRIKIGSSSNNVHYVYVNGGGGGGDGNGSGLPPWAIVLIVFGSLWLLLFISLLIIFWRRERARKSHLEAPAPDSEPTEPREKKSFLHILGKALRYATAVQACIWAFRRCFRRGKSSADESQPEKKKEKKRGGLGMGMGMRKKTHTYDRIEQGRGRGVEAEGEAGAVEGKHLDDAYDSSSGTDSDNEHRDGRVKPRIVGGGGK
ncbi:hypothetical protein F4810DRAFT_647126 [Camillea tinctor]|nr:hypothetical protein F4810DRAFT_647126 [Camillea tinctor]